MKHLIFILSLFILFIGCDPDSIDPNDEKDSQKSSSLVDSAKKALENDLYELIHNGGRVNFQIPQDLYRQAYDADNSNVDANFGNALTNMLIFNQDPQVEAVLEEWADFLNVGGNNGEYLGISSSQNSKQVFPTTQKSLYFPQKQLVNTILNLPKVALIDPPQFNSIQNLIDIHILPKLKLAIDALDVVDNYPDFTFTVTPRMQGDNLADSRELDLTEIYSMEVVLNSLYLFANLMVAYNVDIWGYDSTEAIAVFSKGGNFMKLRNGNAPMNNVKISLFTALDKSVAGLQFLVDETDDQSDDLIPQNIITQAEVTELQLMVSAIKSGIDAQYPLAEDWDNNPATADEIITVDFSAIFDTPIGDLKALLPDYTVTVIGEEIFDSEWNYENLYFNKQVNVPSPGYYYYQRGYQYYGNEEPYTYLYSTLDSPNSIEVTFDSLLSDLLQNTKIKYLSLSVYWNGNLNAGNNNISFDIFYNIETPSRYSKVYLPDDFIWDATTFEEWIFPDPTFSGLIPGMTDSEFKRIFGITEADMY